METLTLGSGEGWDYRPTFKGFDFDPRVIESVEGTLLCRETWLPLLRKAYASGEPLRLVVGTTTAVKDFRTVSTIAIDDLIQRASKPGRVEVMWTALAWPKSEVEESA